MRELELRLALVCYGGASLAVYMNGISNEILKLVRASADLTRRDNETAAAHREAPDTEIIYGELLQLLAPKLRLRVIVDIVSGASAGGINGIFLARALAHDLSLDPIRRMWLDLGDVEELMEPASLVDKWSKAYLYPLLWAFGDRLVGTAKPDAETKRKLFRFLRSRWFEPPFSGTHMLNWMLDAGANMGPAVDGGPSLLPPGHRLDLFVSVTNYHGQLRQLSLHDPDEITEVQHGVSLNFRYVGGPGSTAPSDFGEGNLAGLGFAARATSSFPGAFPPVSLRDLEDALTARGDTWPMKDRFLKRNFRDQMRQAIPLDAMCFIDGGVTNNKPFGAARRAIQNRPANREVDRRIIYVDPLPEKGTRLKSETLERPGFLRTILASLAEIPRSEPIYDDLREIERQNRDAWRLERVQETIEATVNAHVDAMVRLEPDQRVGVAFIASWREQAHEMARGDAGLSYATYMRAKLLQILDHLSRQLFELANDGKTPPDQALCLAALGRWADIEGLQSDAISGPGSDRENLQRLIRFLRSFDVDFRVRRLRFVIKMLNRSLQRMAGRDEAVVLRKIKKRIYRQLEAYRDRWRPAFYEGVDLGDPGEALADADDLADYMRRLGQHMDLETLDLVQDELIADCLVETLDEDLRVELFRAYLGFPFFDILTLPMTSHADLLEIDEVRVDRISPADCAGVFGPAHENPLMGTALYNFGAFFSRRARENDYLWGRLHAATRLLDFLIDAAGPDALPDDFDIEHWRRRLYRAILETESRHMTRIADLVETLKGSIT